jgi:hypothetical protein
VSWDDHHSLSERLAIEADATNRTGDIVRAQDLFARAATEESAALDALPQEKLRTRGITAVSAVALWFKARDYVAAERLANRCLEDPQMPHFAQKQLRESGSPNTALVLLAPQSPIGAGQEIDWGLTSDDDAVFTVTGVGVLSEENAGKLSRVPQSIFVMKGNPFCNL